MDNSAREAILGYVIDRFAERGIYAENLRFMVIVLKGVTSLQADAICTGGFDNGTDEEWSRTYNNIKETLMRWGENNPIFRVDGSLIIARYRGISYTIDSCDPDSMVELRKIIDYIAVNDDFLIASAAPSNQPSRGHHS